MVVSPLMLTNKEMCSILLYAARLRQSIFQVPPEPVDRLGVDIPADVLTRVVIDPVVAIPEGWECAVDWCAIGVDRALALHILRNDREECCAFRVRHEPCAHHLHCPTCDAKYGLFAGSSASFRSLPADVDRPVPPRAADVRLISFADTGEQ